MSVADIAFFCFAVVTVTAASDASTSMTDGAGSVPTTMADDRSGSRPGA